MRAWEEWKAVSTFRAKRGFHRVLYPRTIANYVFDAIARYAIAEFDLDPKVRVIIEAQTIKLCFDEKVIGRFKKGDGDNLGQNHPTVAVLEFIDPQLTIPGLPAAADKVEFIWIGGDLGTTISKVLVVARDVNRRIWEYEIEDAGEGGGVVPLPPPSAPDDGGSGSDLVSPKRKDDAAEDR
jgi:hypothetical protein